jgi:hypothetical protein
VFFLSLNQPPDARTHLKKEEEEEEEKKTEWRIFCS